MPPKILLGIDEVGRGPWAGPLVIGAVVLGQVFHENNPNPASEIQFLRQNLTDSKRLTAKKREELAPLILEHAAATGLGWVSAEELDAHGLSVSLKLAARRAVKQILATKTKFDAIIIDGTINFLTDTPLEDKVSVLPKADALIPEVSAASIIAKVARDAYMVEIATQYPAYGFEKHVGYGTALHRKALLECGICPEHRKSFKPIREIVSKTLGSGFCSDISRRINPSGGSHGDSLDEPCSPMRRRISEQNPSSSTFKGKSAENTVAEHLKTQNHIIIAKNYKTKTYEIDLISVKNGQIFFTEVKYRQNANHGSGLDQITPVKQKQMRYAAEKFLSSAAGKTLLSNFGFTAEKLQPLLAVAAVEGELSTVRDWFPLDC